MEENTWTIVQFLGDGTVEAVPSNWIQGNVCHWPPFSVIKMQAAIRKAEQLNTCWPTHPIKIFRNATYDDYTKARAKAKVAEDTSDLSTEDENNTNKKRKRIQKVLSSSEDSEEESVLASPPNLVKFKIQKLVGKSGTNTPTTSQNPVTTDLFNLMDPHDDHNNTGLDQTIVEQCKAGCSEKDKQFKTEFKTLIQQGHILRGLVTETLNEVKEIKQKLNKKSQEESKSGKTSFFQNENINFPIQDDENFAKFEDYLQNDEKFSDAVEEISKLGGSNTYDFIKRAMRLTLSNDQALKYSWLGLKNNRKFKDTQMARLLLKAAVVTGLTQTQKEIETAIQTWLRRASDRKATIVNKTF